METAPLKSFATWARTALIREVTARIAVVLAPASTERIEQPNAVAALEKSVKAAGGGVAGRVALADKVAYTWFNRIIALRFMDANGYTGIGVVSSERGRDGGQPEVLAEAKRGNIDAVVVTNTRTVGAVTSLLNGARRSDDPQGEAYALLLAEYCRHWNRTMPFMFEREGDFTELLIPANLLADDSVLARAVAVLTEEVCRDVEVIGWLYQFYISERKDEVFAGFKKNQKAGAAEIPAATQLFTPHWIVRYLVENSLGRLWLLNRPTSRLAEQMDFYIAPVDKETDFLRVASPEDLKIIDPACGSGHMLTYAFDLLYAIYEEDGYAPSDIPGLILANNLYGTEIDPRAGALAAFALTMRARARLRTFFNKQVEPNVCVLEPISFTPTELDVLVTASGSRADHADFWNQFQDADTFGSLIQPREELIEPLRHHLETNVPEDGDLLAIDLVRRARRVITQSEFLSKRYGVVVANPPYMGASRMGSHLASWLKQNLPLGRAGLDVAFWERSLRLVVTHGRCALITMQSWMFLATYNGFRTAIASSWTIDGALHLGSGAFPEISGEVVGTVAALMVADSRPDYRATYVRLTSKGLDKEATARSVASGGASDVCYNVSLQELSSIPRTPIAYWMGVPERAAFRLGVPIAEVARSGNGLTSSDNERFLRYWWEVDQANTEYARLPDSEPSPLRWHPINKGGGYRRWAGNGDYVIDWANNGKALYDLRPVSTVRNPELYFRESVSWSDVVTGPVSFRYYPEGCIIDTSANGLFPTGDDIEGLLAFANSSFAGSMAPLLNPGMHFKLGDMGALPYLKRSDAGWRDEVRDLVGLAQTDWDSVETSSGFKGSPLCVHRGAAAETGLIGPARSLAVAERALTQRVHALEAKNSREIARQFALDGVYSDPSPIAEVSLLQNPWLVAERTDDQVYDAQASRALGDLIFYAVGCMFGRYSLDESGLILASQGDTLQDYLAKVPTPTFMPDSDNVIPIVDGDWFEDDIVARFRQFLRVAFGEQHFEENLRFVTETLGVKNLRDYFVKSFYKDHVQRYKKRPIYWLFSSPKGSFSALIYMHRYTPSTVSTVLNEYLREFKAKLEASRQHHERLAAGDGTPRQLAAAQKEVDRLRNVLLELDEYEHDVLYPLATQQVQIDLDDGVKANYSRFGAALKKIPGLEASDE